MIQIPAAQAGPELDKLLSEVAQGQEVVIIGDDGLAFKLVALPRTPKPVFGSAQGLVHIGPDFDEPIEGFEDYNTEARRSMVVDQTLDEVLTDVYAYQAKRSTRSTPDTDQLCKKCRG